MAFENVVEHNKALLPYGLRLPIEEMSKTNNFTVYMMRSLPYETTGALNYSLSLDSFWYGRAYDLLNQSFDGDVFDLGGPNARFDQFFSDLDKIQDFSGVEDKKSLGPAVNYYLDERNLIVGGGQYPNYIHSLEDCLRLFSNPVNNIKAVEALWAEAPMDIISLAAEGKHNLGLLKNLAGIT